SLLVDVSQSALAMTRHMFKGNLKIIIVSHTVDGQIFADMHFPPIAEEYGKEYGVDYVHLGYYAGAEAGIASFLADISSTYPSDFNKIPLEDLPLMQTVKNHEQIDLAICATGGGDILPAWIRQAHTTYGIKMLLIPGGGVITYAVPYYPDQTLGIVGGLRGAAEYELLINRPGSAIAGMDSLSVSFAWLIILMLVCNIGYIRDRLSKGGAV
ncbi:MAG: hypothetical protein KKB59_18595, partial [Spirochaetes bacterium]|nr:hypothetical protein [Spirochaetota bacterium]